MLEEHLVHMPELPLGSRSLRRFGSMSGVRMKVRHGKMAKDKAQVWTQLPLDLFHNRIGKSAIGTFVIPVLHQCHRRGERPLSMIAFTHGYGEMRHLHRRFIVLIK